MTVKVCERLYAKEKVEKSEEIWLIGWFMMLNATFKNIPGKLWWSVLLVEETGAPAENHLTDKLYHKILY
jgi:hypothetical protein